MQSNVGGCFDRFVVVEFRNVDFASLFELLFKLFSDGHDLTLGDDVLGELL